MFKLSRSFIIIIYLSTTAAWAKSNSCTSYLSDQPERASDDFRHSRVWQEFALTNPAKPMSLQARAKLMAFYDMNISQEVFKHAQTYSLTTDEQNQLKADLKLKITEWINVWQNYIYERFENSKIFRESEPSFYQKEIMALREIIENIPASLEETIFKELKKYDQAR